MIIEVNEDKNVLLALINYLDYVYNAIWMQKEQKNCNISINNYYNYIFSLFQDVHVMNCVERTQGDGMENVIADKVESKQSRSRLGDTLIYHPTNLKQLRSTPPVTPTGTIVNLVPKNIDNIKQERRILHSLKSKEPKFVPYEPYKAAVNPIVPFEKKNKKLFRNESRMNATIAQVAAMKIQDNDMRLKDCVKENMEKVLENEWDSEKRVYEAEIRKLKEENSQLETQLKFQAQVQNDYPFQSKKKFYHI